VNYNIDGNYTTICTDNSDNFIEFRLNINVGGTASYTCKIQEIILNTNGTVNETTKSQFNFGIVSQSQYVTGNQVSLIIYQVNLFEYHLVLKEVSDS
jgi:hypothetical protein